MGRHASGATITTPPGSFGDRWGEFRVTVEPAREIGAGRLRGGRTRFRRARTILDYITKAGHPSPDPTVEAVAVPGPSPQSCTLPERPQYGRDPPTKRAVLPLFV